MAFVSRQTSHVLGSVGAVMQTVAGWWDVYSHLSLGNADLLWNPRVSDAVRQLLIYIPRGILYVAAFDVLDDSMLRLFTFARAVIITSAATGAIFYATYYPFTRYLFPWALVPSIWLAPLVAGSIIGAFFGLRVYSGLSSIVVGDVAKGRL